MLKMQNERLTVEANEKGAELFSVRDGKGKEYLWQGNPKYWNQRSPILFPYVGRLKDKTYTYKGKEYHLELHGFAIDTTFKAEQLSETEIRFSMTDSEETYAQFPFRFLFTVTYRLEGNAVKASYDVYNRDDKEMIFGIGAHPGLNVGEKSEDLTDWHFRFPEKRKVDRVGLTDGEVLVSEEMTKPYPLEDDCILNIWHELFDHDAVVLRGACNTVTLEKKDGTDYRVTVTWPEGWYVGFWHMLKTDAPYVCVEPWASLPANTGEIMDFETQKDLIHLAPGGRYTANWEIRIEE